MGAEVGAGHQTTRRGAGKYLRHIAAGLVVALALGAAVLAFYFVLFGASATDVLANYLSVSLNVVLTSFRVLCVVVPLVVYPIAYKICLELQATPGGGKTKRHNIVVRSAEGGYSTVPSEARSGDAPPEFPPIPLDTAILLPVAVVSPVYQVPPVHEAEAVDRSSVGARAAAGMDGAGTDGNGASPEGRRAFRIPRNYR